MNWVDWRRERSVRSKVLFWLSHLSGCRSGIRELLRFTECFSSRHQLEGDRLMKKMMIAIAICGALFGTTSRAIAATVTIDPSANWLGFMNVYELPSNGGARVYGEPWGLPALTATFSGPVLSLSAATVGDPNSFWYTPSGGPGAPGNKNMFASAYVETNGGVLGGQSVTFTGQVVSNSLVAPYAVKAFIKDFAPDYSSNTFQEVPVVNGVFSVTHVTAGDPARHVQYGFETIGPNVWPTDGASKGFLQVQAIPEPTSLALGGLGAMAALMLRRRRA
jgi:hypothetical protein